MIGKWPKSSRKNENFNVINVQKHSQKTKTVWRTYEIFMNQQSYNISVHFHATGPSLPNIYIEIIADCVMTELAWIWKKSAFGQ